MAAYLSILLVLYNITIWRVIGIWPIRNSRRKLPGKSNLLETPEQFFNKTEDISKLLCNCHLPHPRLYSYIKCILGIHREFSAVPIEYQSLRVHSKIAITDNVQLRKWLPIPTQTEKITMQLDEQVACGRFPSAAFNIQLRVVAKLQFKHLIWGP